MKVNKVQNEKEIAEVKGNPKRRKSEKIYEKFENGKKVCTSGKGSMENWKCGRKYEWKGNNKTIGTRCNSTFKGTDHKLK